MSDMGDVSPIDLYVLQTPPPRWESDINACPRLESCTASLFETSAGHWNRNRYGPNAWGRMRESVAECQSVTAAMTFALGFTPVEVEKAWKYFVFLSSHRTKNKRPHIG